MRYFTNVTKIFSIKDTKINVACINPNILFEILIQKLLKLQFFNLRYILKNYKCFYELIKATYAFNKFIKIKNGDYKNISFDLYLYKIYKMGSNISPIQSVSGHILRKIYCICFPVHVVKERMYPFQKVQNA